MTDDNKERLTEHADALAALARAAGEIQAEATELAAMHMAMIEKYEPDVYEQIGARFDALSERIENLSGEHL